jgi:hypothetical protein
MKNLYNNIKSDWWKYLLSFFLIIIALGILSVTINNLNFSSSYSGGSKIDYYESGDLDYRSNYVNAQDSFAPEIEKRVIQKDANINIETRNYDQIKLDIINLASSKNAIILNENENYYSDNYRKVNFRFKIESLELENFLNQLQTYGDTRYYNIQIRDVTSSHADYTSRLERYENQMIRYENMLNSDLDVDEEIKIQSRIDSIENSIFSIKSSLRNIEENSIYSDVNLELKEKKSYLADINFISLKDSLKLFIQSLDIGIRFLVSILGFIIPFTLIYVLYRFWRHFRK